MANYTANNRKRDGGDSRGSSEARRRSKHWLLSPESGHDYGQGWISFNGNGETVPCIHCGKTLTFGTLERDRIIPGNSYARANLQPSCRQCNSSRNNRIDWISPLQRIAMQSA